MKSILKWFVSVVAVLSFALQASASESASFNSGKTVAQLVTSHDRAMPGSDIHIALSMRLEKHWHTYWRNAGGPGKPARFNWALPEGYQVGDIIWPLPEIIHTQTIVSYAFEDRLLLPMLLHIPATAKIGESVTINTEALYLVCHILCLPEGANLSVTFDIGEPLEDARWNANIKKTIKHAPKPNSEFTASVQMQAELVLLNIKSTTLSASKIRKPYFFPYVQDMINADDPQSFKQFERGIQMVLKPSWKLDDGLPEGMTGVLAFETKTIEGWENKSVIVTANSQTSVNLGSVGVTSHKPSRSLLFWLSLIVVFLMCLALGAALAKRRAVK